MKQDYQFLLLHTAPKHTNEAQSAFTIKTIQYLSTINVYIFDNAATK